MTREELKEFIKSNYDKYTLVELCDILKKNYNKEITPKNMSKITRRMGLSKINMIDKSIFLDDEIFKTIPGFSNYKISQYGKLLNTRQNNLITIGTDRRGYKIAKISDDNKKKRTMPLHRLLAYAWIHNDNPKEKIQVDHIDGNKLNNDLNNLEWVSPRENLIRARKNKLNNSKPTHNKIDDDIVKNIFLYYKSNPNIPYTEVAKKFNVSAKSVSNIVTGKRRKDITNNL